MDKKKRKGTKLVKRQNDERKVIPLSSGRALRKCPVCGRKETLDFTPFCSARCADVDLSRWLREEYRIPSAEESLREEEGTDTDED